MKDWVFWIYGIIGMGAVFGINMQITGNDTGFRIFASVVSFVFWPMYIGIKLVISQ